MLKMPTNLSYSEIERWLYITNNPSHKTFVIGETLNFKPEDDNSYSAISEYREISQKQAKTIKNLMTEIKRLTEETHINKMLDETFFEKLTAT